MNGSSSIGMITIGRIMSRSSCSRMWQWYMWRPLYVSKRTASSTISLGDRDGDRMSREDLEGIQVDVQRMRVARQVDELPDLVVAQHREEGDGVLEVAGDRAVAGD